MENFNLIRRQIQELIFKISNNNNIPYSLVRTIEKDVKSSASSNDIEELKNIKFNLENLIENPFSKISNK